MKIILHVVLWCDVIVSLHYSRVHEVNFNWWCELHGVLWDLWMWCEWFRNTWSILESANVWTLGKINMSLYMYLRLISQTQSFIKKSSLTRYYNGTCIGKGKRGERKRGHVYTLKWHKFVCTERVTLWHRLDNKEYQKHKIHL